jgi:hypothetical protein
MLSTLTSCSEVLGYCFNMVGAHFDRNLSQKPPDEICHRPIAHLSCKCCTSGSYGSVSLIEPFDEVSVQYHRDNVVGVYTRSKSSNRPVACRRMVVEMKRVTKTMHHSLLIGHRLVPHFDNVPHFVSPCTAAGVVGHQGRLKVAVVCHLVALP